MKVSEDVLFVVKVSRVGNVCGYVAAATFETLGWGDSGTVTRTDERDEVPSTIYGRLCGDGERSKDDLRTMHEGGLTVGCRS